MCFFFNKGTCRRFLRILSSSSSVGSKGRIMVGRGDADYCVMGYNVFRMTDNFIAFRKWEIIMSLYDSFWDVSA